jgi:hypothetical protein
MGNVDKPGVYRFRIDPNLPAEYLLGMYEAPPGKNKANAQKKEPDHGLLSEFFGRS